MHNLVDPFPSEEESGHWGDYKWICDEVTAFLDSCTDEDLLNACQFMMSNTPPDFRMKHLDIWHKKLERWSKVISYFKRQTLYTYSRQNGRGGVSGAGEILGVTRQRAHTMYQEAESERLAQFTPKEYCKFDV
tara:strand:- start:5762 stop:6160 length:399 start_codon:yes stop_codon:yes gene_type:complete